MVDIKVGREGHEVINVLGSVRKSEDDKFVFSGREEWVEFV